MSFHRSIYRDFLKAVLDRAVAFMLLVLFSPILAAVGVAVRIYLGSPILFAQTRPGKDGRPFRMLKFRSMTSQRDRAGNLLSDAERLTRFGRWLRSTSLDELPELWNVMRGEMSLVGPRPLLMEYLSLYNSDQARRHEVKPGLTGLAQVNGRNALSWDQKFAYDIQYVEQLSLRIDLLILGKTLAGVLRRQGITAPTHSTMPSFTGSGGTGSQSLSEAA